MNYDMTQPCGNCPFRKQGGVKLSKARIRDIAGMMLDRQGGTFPCHKTVDYSNDENGRETTKSQHCAGALAFAEKHGNATQMMRIVERLGMYDASKIDDEAKALVWDSKSEWLANGTCNRKKGGAA